MSTGQASFSWDDHRKFMQATEGNDVATMKDYLARGYDPDERNAEGQRRPPLTFAAARGANDSVDILIAALKERYAEQPEKLLEALSFGRRLNQVQRGVNKVVDAILGAGDCSHGWRNVLMLAKKVDDEMQTVIDAMPVSSRRTMQIKYPPLDVNRYR